jgi:hypothetical protein
MHTDDYGKWCLKVTGWCLAIVVVCALIMCSGCAHTQKAQPNCAVNAITCAWTWGLNHGGLLRIAVYKVEAGVEHSQAEAFIKGKWTPLTEVWTGDHFDVIPYRSHYPGIEPYRYATLREWIAEQLRFANQ